VFEKYGINHYHTPSITKWKAAIAERAIRTIKTRLERYFDQNNTKKWIDFLPKLVKNYNSTPHRTIGMAPNQVTDKNSQEIYKRVFGDINLKVTPRLGVGDRVRIIIDKSIFEKGYSRGWTNEIYIINKVIQQAGVVWYELVDFKNKEVPGIKYFWQLNLVSKYVSDAKRKHGKNR